MIITVSLKYGSVSICMQYSVQPYKIYKKNYFWIKHKKEISQYFVSSKLYLTKLVLKKRNKKFILEPNAFIKIDRYPEKKMS